MENDIVNIDVSTLPDALGWIIALIIGTASAAANKIGKATIFGRIINWIALNITVEKKK